MSRPKLSEPNQRSADGGRSLTAGFISRGSPVHQSGARTPAPRITTSVRAPAMGVGWRRSARRAVSSAPARAAGAGSAKSAATGGDSAIGSVPDPGIEHHVEHVDDQIDQDVHAGDDED